jgi:hypothetical protein
MEPPSEGRSHLGRWCPSAVITDVGLLYPDSHSRIFSSKAEKLFCDISARVVVTIPV